MKPDVNVKQKRKKRDMKKKVLFLFSANIVWVWYTDRLNRKKRVDDTDKDKDISFVVLKDPADWSKWSQAQ